MPSLTRSGSPLLPSSNRRRRSSSFSICATPRVNTYSTDSRVGCCFTVTTKPSRIGLIISLPHCSRIGVSRRGGKGVGRHLEIMLVIPRFAKDLARRTQRSFPFAKRGASAHALRMTGRIARKSAHGKSYLQMSGTFAPFTTCGGTGGRARTWHGGLRHALALLWGGEHIGDFCKAYRWRLRTVESGATPA